MLKIKATKRLDGFGHNWTLELVIKKEVKKSFFLGQDIKFTSRVLGYNFQDLIKDCTCETKSNLFESPKTQRWLVDRILEAFGTNRKDFSKEALMLESYDLACE